MTTRQDELIRVLSQLAEDLPDPQWVALVDSDGLVVASVPDEPPIEAERFAAMTAVTLSTGQRVLRDIDGGSLLFSSIAGSERQLLTVVIGEDRLLSLELGPEVPVRSTFGALSRNVPKLLRTLQMRISQV